MHVLFFSQRNRTVIEGRWFVSRMKLDHQLNLITSICLEQGRRTYFWNWNEGFCFTLDHLRLDANCCWHFEKVDPATRSFDLKLTDISETWNSHSSLKWKFWFRSKWLFKRGEGSVLGQIQVNKKLQNSTLFLERMTHLRRPKFIRVCDDNTKTPGALCDLLTEDSSCRPVSSARID